MSFALPEPPSGPTRSVPTRRGLWLLVLGLPLALAVVLGLPALWPYWLGFATLGLLLLLADRLLAPRLGRLLLDARLPEPFVVGPPQPVTLVCRNDTGFELVLRLVLDVEGPVAPVVPVAGLRLGRGPGELRFALTPTARGQVAVRAAWLATTGPLGLMAVQRRYALDVEADIVPDLGLVSRTASQLLAAPSRQLGRRVARLVGDGSEFDHLREYVPGLDLRFIDWKATARHARPLWRQMRTERNRQVILAVDSGRLMNEPIDGLPRLDHAIHAALTLATVSLHVGDQVGLVSFDDRLRQYCPPLRGREALSLLNRTAARIAYSTAETNFTLGLMELSRRQTRRALVVVLTDFVDTITAELMVENIGRIASRHLVLFVAFQDPLLGRIAGGEPQTLLALNRAVVAHGLVAERELVLRRLARLGVLCIDQQPGPIATTLVDRYLDAKRKELF